MRFILIALFLTASAHAQFMPVAFWKSSAAAPFSPLDIDSCVAWYDASDSITITHASQVVSEWRDKSPYMHDAAQGAANARPALHYAVINGLPSAYFLGIGGDYLIVDSVTYKSHYITVCWVGTMESGTAAYGRVFAWSSAFNSPDYNNAAHGLVGRDNSTNAIVSYSVSSLSSKAVSLATAFQGTAIWDGANNATRINQSAGSSASSSGLFALASPGGIWHIGSEIPLSFGYWTGYIGELIVYKRALSAGELAQVEGYLKAKWGTP